MFFSNWFLPSSSRGIKPRSLCLHDERLTDQVTSLVFYLYTFQKGYLWYWITRWTARGRRKPTRQRLKALSVLMSLGDHAKGWMKKLPPFTECPDAGLGCLQLHHGVNGLRSKVCLCIDNSLILSQAWQSTYSRRRKPCMTWDLTLLGGREFCCSSNTLLTLRITGLAIEIDPLGI